MIVIFSSGKCRLGGTCLIGGSRETAFREKNLGGGRADSWLLYCSYNYADIFSVNFTFWKSIESSKM